MTKVSFHKTAAPRNSKSVFHQKKIKHRESSGNHPKKTNQRPNATLMSNNQAEQEVYELAKKHVEFKLVLGDTLRV